jgi:hypothetical protein
MQKPTVMNEEESFKNEKEILSHFENLKTGLLKALRTGVFQNFDEATQMKISIAVVQKYIEESLVGTEFDK